MSRAATVHVPDGTLRWGRVRAHAELADAAERCGHPQADLQSWEDGDADPPLSALRELATFYGLPLAAFLLSKPKDEPKPTVDQRRLAGVAHPRTNRHLALALNRAIGLQSVASELMEALDAAPFVTERGGIGPEELARAERSVLGVTVDEQLSWRDEGVALSKWRAAIERRGVLVMQAPLAGTDVRAFSLRGDPPAIVLDRADWVRARIFSLGHELGHVALGGSGICIPGSIEATGIEAYCNHFADALLVPTEAIAKDDDVRRIKSGAAADEPLVKRLANRYKVSPAVVWYRLRQVNAISAAVFDRGWSGWSAWRPPMSVGGGGQPTAKNVVRDFGVALPDLLLRASKKGLMHEADVAQYLGVDDHRRFPRPDH